MVAVSPESGTEKLRFLDNVLQSWLHAALMVNDFIAHTAAAAVMLVAVKSLALLFLWLWRSGFKAFEGTPYEFSVETIFVTAEISVFVVYGTYAVVRGVNRCFGN